MQHAQSSDPTAGTGIAPTVPPIRSMHDILSNRLRRAIITVLQEADGSVDVTELNQQVLEWRERPACSRHEPDVSEQQHRLVLQAHLTRMARFDLLQYDSTGGTVRLYDDVTFSFRPHPSVQGSDQPPQSSGRTKSSSAD